MISIGDLQIIKQVEDSNIILIINGKKIVICPNVMAKSWELYGSEKFEKDLKSIVVSIKKFDKTNDIYSHILKKTESVGNIILLVSLLITLFKDNNK